MAKISPKIGCCGTLGDEEGSSRRRREGSAVGTTSLSAFETRMTPSIL